MDLGWGVRGIFGHSLIFCLYSGTGIHSLHDASLLEEKKR
jgi:hypothetical protein